MQHRADAIQDGSQNNLVSTFIIRETIYGIDAMRIQEVVRVGEVTKVHHAPASIVGIMNLRGKIVTVIDLARKLDLGPIHITPKCRIVIVEWMGEYVGLLVDAVSDVVPIDLENLSAPPPNVKGAQGRFLQSVFQSEKDLIAILDLETILNEEES